jgi:hypothetical protein
MANETTKLTTRWSELSDSERTLVNSMVNAIASGRPSWVFEGDDWRAASPSEDDPGLGQASTGNRLRDILIRYYPGAELEWVLSASLRRTR